MRSVSELRDLMDTLQKKKQALENSLRANGDSSPSYFSMTQSPPTTPNLLSPITTSSPISYQEQTRRLYSSERPPLAAKVPAHSSSSMPPSPRRSDPRERDASLPYSRPMTRNQSQDSFSSSIHQTVIVLGLQLQPSQCGTVHPPVWPIPSRQRQWVGVVQPACLLVLVCLVDSPPRCRP